MIFAQIGLCQNSNNKEEIEMEIEKLTCKELGINGIQQIINRYELSSRDEELKQIADNSYEKKRSQPLKKL